MYCCSIASCLLYSFCPSDVVCPTFPQVGPELAQPRCLLDSRPPLMRHSVSTFPQVGPELAQPRCLLDSRPPLMRHSVSTFPQVGPELAQPRCISWDPSLNFVALAYASQVCGEGAAVDRRASLPLGVCEAQCGVRVRLHEAQLRELRHSTAQCMHHSTAQHSACITGVQGRSRWLRDLSPTLSSAGGDPVLGSPIPPPLPAGCPVLGSPIPPPSPCRW